MKDENEKVVPNERMIDEELKEIAKSIDLSDWKKLKKMTAQSFFKKFSLMDDEKIKNYFENSEIIFQKNMLIPEYIKKYYFLEVNSFLKNPTCEENQISNIQSEAKKLKIELKKFNGKYKTKKELCKEIQRKKNFPSEATNFSKSESTENDEYFIEENSDYGNSENNLELIKKFGYEKWNDMNNLDIIKFYKKYHTFSNEEIEESLKNVAKENGISNWKELKKMTLISFVKNFPDENENLNEILEINNLEMIKKFGYEKWNDMNKLDIIKFYKKYHTFSIEEIEETLKDVAKENGISNWKELKKMTLISFLKKFPDEKENLNNKMANNLELIKKCNNYTFDEVEQEAERSGIDLLKSDGTIKTKKELCKEIVEYDISCENINSQKTIIPRNNSCKKVKKIKNCKTTNSLSNKIRSRSPSPIRISSKSFSNKSDCMKHLKSPIEQEAKRLGISLKDDCGKNKTKQKLCDEINEKYSPERISSRKCSPVRISSRKCSPVRISSRKCSPVRISSPQIPKSFSNKSDCMKHLKPPIEQEAKRLGISLKDDYGKNKTKQQLCDEIKKNYKIFKKKDISAKEISKNRNNIEKKSSKYYDMENDKYKTEKNFINCEKCITCQYAAFYGHLECLKYLHQNNYPWDEWTFGSAAANGHLDCLKYLHENNCPWNEYLCSYAAFNGHLDCLKYLHKNKYFWNEYTCQKAAMNGHIDCLEYARKNGCPWNKLTFEGAASNGQLECLEYLYKNNCPWDEWTCISAVENGHLKCLRYLHENNCPWTELACQYAAKNGHLKCLKYLHENGCLWNANTCLEAAKNGHLECLKYAVEKGCPLDKNDCKKNTSYDLILKFIENFQ
jgi:hypothetical protein